PGRGSVRQGQALFAELCSSCHGDRGQGAPAGTFGAGQTNPFEPLTGGRGTLTAVRPLKTVGSFWPFAPTLFDFINRAMPFNAPQSLTPDQVYA
ncbi:c-type cytochrome, partial [Providencia stuartii]|uniref:c-type cytochrome n=1 Tax=Providencia stuartii TaxID=588 RepID=UPI0013D86CC1